MEDGYFSNSVTPGQVEFTRRAAKTFPVQFNLTQEEIHRLKRGATVKIGEIQDSEPHPKVSRPQYEPNDEKRGKKKGILSAFNKALENRKKRKFQKRKNQNVIAERSAQGWIPSYISPHQENGDTPGQTWPFVVESGLSTEAQIHQNEAEDESTKSYRPRRQSGQRQYFTQNRKSKDSGLGSQVTLKETTFCSYNLDTHTAKETTFGSTDIVDLGEPSFLVPHAKPFQEVDQSSFSERNASVARRFSISTHTTMKLKRAKVTTLASFIPLHQDTSQSVPHLLNLKDDPSVMTRSQNREGCTRAKVYETAEMEMEEPAIEIEKNLFALTNERSRRRPVPSPRKSTTSTPSTCGGVVQIHDSEITIGCDTGTVYDFEAMLNELKAYSAVLVSDLIQSNRAGHSPATASDHHFHNTSEPVQPADELSDYSNSMDSQSNDIEGYSNQSVNRATSSQERTHFPTLDQLNQPVGHIQNSMNARQQTGMSVNNFAVQETGTALLSNEDRDMMAQASILYEGNAAAAQFDDPWMELLK